MKVLVIDDAPDIAEVVELCFELRWPGTTVFSAGDGASGMELLRTQGADMVVLDVGLPGDDGYKVCREIRRTSQVPIIMVTGQDRDEDKVRGLELGADDYVTKPFSTTELAARVKAVLRRYDGGGIPAPVEDPEPQPTPQFKLVPPDQTVDEEMYEGTVKLTVETAGYIRAMIQFVDELRNNQHFHLLRLTANQRREGMDIWLRLREPLDLKSTLLQMEGVSNVAAADVIDPDSSERQLIVSLG